MPRIAEDVYIKIEDTKGELICKEKRKVKKGEGCQHWVGVKIDLICVLFDVYKAS